MDAITTTLKPFKREFSFIDKKGSRVKVEAEITFRNGYAEFTSCGDCGSGSGQCQDSIHPANEPQKKYLQLWGDWHLNGMNAGCEHQRALLKEFKEHGTESSYEDLKKLPSFQKCPSCGYEYGSAWKHRELPEDFEAQLVSTINAIVAADQERLSKSCADLSVEEIEKAIEEKGLSFDSQDCVIALAQLYSVPLDEIENIEEEGDNRYTVLGVSYLAGNDSEMDTALDEYLDNYLEECVEGSQGQYFDTEAWKRDARIDGRGNALNHYDGGEDEIEVNGETYYSYRS